ncbi:MAG: hypothetical protein ABI318_13650 [Chthoniobacteraceae bacterium]
MWTATTRTRRGWGFDQRDAKEKRYGPHGPLHFEVKNGGIEYLSGRSNYRRPGKLRSPFFAEDFPRKCVTQDGWYRVKVNAGAYPLRRLRTRAEAPGPP